MPTPTAYRSPRAAATAAVVLLAVVGAATLFVLATDVRLFSLAGGLAGGVVLAEQADFTDVDQLQQTAGTIHLVAFLVSAVVFVNWFQRVRANAGVFDPLGHRFSQGWAVGGWVVPVGTLWIPRQIAGDIWKASGRPDESGVRPPAPQGLLNLWWGAFWISNLLERIGSRINSGAADWGSYRTSLLWIMASDVLELVAAGLAAAVVLRLTGMQEQRCAESTVGPHGVHISAVEG
ncbi:DUF4328 domain-containing protein [Kitasatospora sp. NPDC048538]|uniref:DUF4328 domain-containing protein n=1 Tax=unclassified Kitasatospora TaxID=2633591 RepID=UPI00340F7DFB